MSPSKKSGSRSKSVTRKKASKPARAAKKKTAAKKTAARKKAAKKTARKTGEKKAAAKVAKKAASKVSKKKATAGKKAAGKAAKKKAAGKPARKATARKKSPAQAAPAAGATVVRTEPRISTVQRNTESWEKARKAYSAAMKLVQEHHWRRAAQALSDFLAEHGRERELCQRARTYLRVASSQMGAEESTPETVEDFCLQATVLANDGRLKEAVRMLDTALEQQPDSDKTLYLKASTLALMRDRQGALTALARAIKLNDQNRIWAANNPDFADLRDDEEFITLTTREDEEY